MLDALGLESRGLSSAGAEVQDNELKDLEEGVYFEILLFGIRRVKHPESPYPEPMETWHGLCRGKGGLYPRSIRGRAMLGDQIRAQVIDNGLCYANVATGELERIPGHQGVWTLASPEGGKALLLVRTKFDTTKGKLAGNGKRMAYVTKSGGVALEKARAVYPELATLSLDAALALPMDATGERLLDTETVTVATSDPNRPRGVAPVPQREDKPAKSKARG